MRLPVFSLRFEYNALKLFQTAVGSLSRGSAIRKEIESRIDYFFDNFNQLFELNFNTNAEERKDLEGQANGNHAQQSVHYSVPSQLLLLLAPEKIVLFKDTSSALKTIRYHLRSPTNKSFSLCRAAHGLTSLLGNGDLSLLAAEDRGELEALSKLSQFQLGVGLGAELPRWTFHFLLSFSLSEARKSKSSVKLRRLLSLYSADRPIQLTVLACMLHVLNLEPLHQHGGEVRQYQSSMLTLLDLAYKLSTNIFDISFPMSQAAAGGIFSEEFDLSWADTDASSSSLLLHILGLLTLSSSEGPNKEKVRNRVAQSLLQIRLNNLLCNRDCMYQLPFPFL